MNKDKYIYTGSSDGYIALEDYLSRAMDFAPRSYTKYFKLGKTKVEVVNHRNKEFWIENLVIGLESNNEVNVMSRGSVQVDSLKELGAMIKKYRNTYRRMLELSKQLRMSEDFE
jgi:hypothetical protein